MNDTTIAWVRARLETITHAVRGLTTENGTTSEQDQLLFETGFIHELRTTTDCGTSITLVRVDGRVEGRVDVKAWLAHYQANPIVEVGAIGLVRITPPSDAEVLDHRLYEELGGNAMHFLPQWAKEAVRKAFVERTTQPDKSPTEQVMDKLDDLPLPPECPECGGDHPH